MSDEDVRKVSLQDIQLVQNLIERCLQLYMTQREVVSTLLDQAKIEPGFTELVWQKLEAENQEFFRAYHLRLIVKGQIMRFNQLLQRQAELMHQMHQAGVAPLPNSNGSQIHSLHNSAFQAPQPTGPLVKQETLHQAMNIMPNVYTNGASSLQAHAQIPVNMSGHVGRMDVTGNMLLSQNSNVGMMQGVNGVMVKQEGSFTGDSPFMFGADNAFPEPRNSIGEPSVSPFGSTEAGSGTMNGAMLDPEANSYGFLGQIPRNFSLSDLTADFSNSTDILESYSGSPFLGADTNFMDPQIRTEQPDMKRLDTISEGLSYEDFGSD
ncbi:uncharacterized protein LOC127258211 isoform X2 [Andrographis paniculata]|uniref:uncharacterized protein LOC127258211 isoform X2 n=1 Tax=Andrographis paniculata TaxID=175694 RepID=UPI0021E99F56|nr:uncharacterized protein LOC127258211 isoform X2 [Andrographis paniculata]